MKREKRGEGGISLIPKAMFTNLVTQVVLREFSVMFIINHRLN